MNCSPICLFTYNRLSETKKTVEALKNNPLASESELFVFSDAWKNNAAKNGVLAVREFIKSIDGFKSITIIERQDNFGLAKSIITGVSEIIDRYGRVIVLEDDLITSTNFLSYMNNGLDFYKENKKVWSVSGFSFSMKYPENHKYDHSFGVRASSWGWATWVDRWDKVDWKVEDYNEFVQDKESQRRFKLGGSDLCKMLNDQVSGAINSWAIRFCYAQFKNNTVDVFPKISKVKSIGFGGDATHTSGMGSRFDTILDETNSTKFIFSEDVSVDPAILKQFRRPFSIVIRLKYKLLALFK